MREEGLPPFGDSLKEACGIFGVYAPGEDVSRLTFFSLFALQHRGQESAGIATFDGQRLHCNTAMGLVSQAFTEETLSRLTGEAAIGHNRYSTTGSNRPANAQPIVISGNGVDLALAHNGNIVNSLYLRQELAGQGIAFSTGTDSEVIAWLLVMAPGKGWQEKIKYVMGRLQGAYSLVLLTREGVFGIRDPWGIRPLCLGRLNGGWVLASESCALDHIGASFLREVQAGEAVLVNGSGVTGFQGRAVERRALCVFEFIYFARPDSIIEGKLLYPARQAMGERLAEEYPEKADLVMGIPDSATAAGIGYSYRSGIPFTEGVMKNRYVGRTFIQPDQRLRELGVQLKFNPLPEILSGKRLVVVDDSIVRGTTTPRVVSLLRQAGAREVHLRICAPPIRYPCFYGVDMATQWELIAARKSVAQIARHVGADTLGYLSIPGLLQSVGLPREKLCLACFTGEYPVPVQLAMMDKLALEAAERA